MKGFLISFILFFAFTFTNAQRNVFDGYIITSKGKKIEGVIQVPQYKAPWQWQEKIFFHKGITTEKEKIKKNKGEKYSPKDIDGYGLNDGTEFRSIKYINMSGANQGDNLSTLNQASTTFANLKSSRFFAEVVHLGEKINVYKFYNSPPGFSISSGEETEELNRISEEARIFYDVLVWKKEDKKAKDFDSVSIKKYFAECSMIHPKFKDMGYMRKPLKGLKTAMNNAMLEGAKKEAACMEMVTDYESCN